MDSGRPVASSETIRRRMQQTRRRDTGPELALRSILHRDGFRFRTDFPVAGRRRADIAFTRARVAVFVDGCFWHGCPRHGTWPKANAAWWRDKIEANRRRDRETDELLARSGWTVIRVWEHEDPRRAAEEIEEAVRAA